MRVLLLKGTGGFQYEVVNVFAEELGNGLKENGCEVRIVDVFQPKEEMYKEVINELYLGIDLVVHFNGFIVEPINGIDNVYDIFNVLEIPCAVIFVDHPFYHAARINKLSKNKNVLICMYSEGFLYTFENYINENIPIAQLMHAGTLSENIIEEKIYDIVIAGTINQPIDFYKEISKVEDEFLKKLFIKIYENVCENYSIPLDLYFDEELKKNGILFDEIKMNQPLASLIMSVYTLIDRDLRQRVRYQALKTLAEAGFSIELYGNCSVENLEQYKNIHINTAVDYKDLLGEISKSKIVVHDLNVCINGSHERVLSSMLNKTMVISNVNYFDMNNIKNGESIIYYDVNNPQDLIDKVKFYLENDDERNYIINNAYDIVKEKHTWTNRAKQLIDIYNSFKKMIV